MAAEPIERTEGAPGHVAETAPPRPAPPPHRPAPPPAGGSKLPMVLTGLVVLAAAGFGVYWFALRDTAEAGETPAGAAAGEEGEGAAGGEKLVEVTHPTQGGLERVTTQPGTVLPFEAADLYAKISGYLKVLNVDIGDRVEQGDLLAVIDDPEALKAVDQRQAALEQAQAAVETVKARIETAKADLEAAQAAVTKAEADVKETTATRVYRESELARIKNLVARQAVEDKLLDEEQEKYSSAVAAESAAEANVLYSKALVSASKARISQAQADLLESQANVQVAQADLEEAQVIAAYTEIHSPYDGVITARNYFRGAFIKAADQGETLPMLAVARTDKLRVVVMVPDRDVPFVNRGDPAYVHVDALPGREFEAVVSRYSESEDPGDRTMHTEVDLDNSDAKLQVGMYGGVRLVLQQPEADALTLPASALVARDGKGNGSVYVVRDGKINKVDVRVGQDNGVKVEILKGLTTGDEVVVSYNGSLSEGLAVRTEPYTEVQMSQSE